MSPGGLAGHSAALIGSRDRAVPNASLRLCRRLVPGICGDRGFGAHPGHIPYFLTVSTTIATVISNREELLL